MAIDQRDVFTIDPSSDQMDTFSIPEENKNIVSPKISEERRGRIMLAVGPENKTLPTTLVDTYLQQGREHVLRSELAATKDREDMQHRTELLQQMINTHQGGPYSPDEIRRAVGLSSEVKNDPSTIVESMAARRVVDTTLQKNGGSVYSDSLNNDLDTTDKITDATESLLTKKNILASYGEELRDKVSKQNWGSWGVDFAKTLVPGYSGFKKSAVSSDTNRLLGTILPGSSIEQTMRELWAIEDPSLFNKRIREIIDPISVDNPQLAANMLYDIQHWTSYDKYMENLFGVVDAATVGSAVLGKTAGKTARAIREAEGIRAPSIGDLPESSKVWDAPTKYHPARDIPESSPYWDLPTSMHPAGSPPESSTLFDLPTSMHPKILPEEARNPTARLKEVLKDTTEMASRPGSSVPDVVAASGELEKASEVAIATGRVPTTLEETIKRVEDPLDGLDSWMKEVVPSIADPKKMFDSPYDLAKDRAKKIQDTLVEQAEMAKASLFDVNFVPRIDKTIQYTDKTIEQARKQVSRLYGNNVANGIVDTKFVSGSKMGTNVDRVEVLIGRADGTMFDTAAEAKGYADHLGMSGESLYIHKVADGNYALRFRHNVNESDPSLRDVILTSRTETPVSTSRMILGNIASADKSLSKSQNEVRSMAISGASEVHRIIGELGKRGIEQLSKKEFQELDAFMADAQRVVRTRANGEKTLGKYYDSTYEFRNAWMSKYGTYPSDTSTEAYFTIRQILDMDYMSRTVDIYKAKAIDGVGEVTIALKNDSGKIVRSQPFEGRLLDNIPFEKGGNAKILVIDNSGGFTVTDFKTIDLKMKRKLNKLVSSGGAKVTQVYDDAANLEKIYSMIGTGSAVDPIRYVVSNDLKYDILDISKQLPYNEGGHQIERLNWRIKSGKTSGTPEGIKYFGENTVAGFVREHEAKSFFKGAEEARAAYKLALSNVSKSKPLDLSSVDAALARNNMPWSAKQFKQMVDDGLINPEVPLVVAKDGSSYHDLVNLNDLGIRNELNNPHRLHTDFNVKYTGERGLGTQSFEKGGSMNPGWNAVNTRMLSPMDMVQRSVSETINSRFYTDYMIRLRREFAEQFGDLVEGGKDRLLRTSVSSFVHPIWKKGADPVRLSAAKRMHMAGMQLMYSNSEISKEVMAAKDSMLNSIYKKFGDKAGDWVEDSAIWKTRDPSRFLRGIAFHTQIGLFNPVQLALNTQTLFYMGAISPKHAPGAVKDSILLRMLEMNNTPQIFNHLAKKSGYKYFDEMARELRKSGFSDINGTVAHLDDALEPKTFMTKGGRFLDTATIFFKESEGGLKRTAYSVAYREWREANPEAVIDDFARQQIVGRAKNLNVQMSKDSQAIWQKGWKSIPTQFLSYNLRMSEQLLEGISTGKGALTRAEAARAIAMNSMLYGIPAGGIGGTIGLWPVGETFREYQIKNALDYDASPIGLFLTEGIYQTLAHYSDGQKWNFGERYAPGNNQVLKDIIEGRTNVLEALTGPSGSMTYSIFKKFYPGVAYIAATMSENPESEFPLTSSDIFDLLRETGTGNNAVRGYLAYKTGLWLNKNEQAMTKVQGTPAALSSILGLSPQEATDSFKIQNILKNRAQAKDELLKMYDKELERAFSYSTEGDKDNAEKHFKRAKFLMSSADLSIADKNEVFKKALKFQEPKFDSLSRKLLFNESNNEIFDRRLQNLKDKENR